MIFHKYKTIRPPTTESRVEFIASQVSVRDSSCPQIKDRTMVPFEEFFVTTKSFYCYDRLSPYLLYLNPLEGSCSLLLAKAQRHFAFLCLAYALSGQVLQIYLGYAKTGDMVAVTESLAWVLLGIITVEVFRTFYLRTGQTTNIIRHLKELYPSDAATQEEIKLREVLDPLKWGFRCFQTAYLITIGFKISLPILVNLNNLLVGRTVTLSLPLNVWYPFDPLNPIVMVFVYIFEAWAAILITCPLIALIALIAGITSVFCVQFRLLCLEFRKLNCPKYHSEDMRKLKALVQRHSAMIALGEEINEIFSSFLLSNYVVCSASMSLFLFVAVTSTKQDVVIEYTGNLICNISYILTLSIFGHRYKEHVS